MAQGSVDVGVAETCQLLADGAACRDRSQTHLVVSAVLFQALLDQGLDSGTVICVKITATDKVLGQTARLVERPGLEGGDELSLVDQPILEGNQAEEQVFLGGDGAQGYVLRKSKGATGNGTLGLCQQSSVDRVQRCKGIKDCRAAGVRSMRRLCDLCARFNVIHKIGETATAATCGTIVMTSGRRRHKGVNGSPNRSAIRQG